MSQTLRESLGPPSPALLRSAQPAQAARAYWELVIWGRQVSIVVLGVLAWTIPAVGDDRHLVSALLLGAVVPYNILLGLATRKLGRVPSIIPFTDLLFAAIVLVLSPATWPVVLLITLGSLSLMPLAIGFNKAVAAAITAIVGLSIAGGLSLPAGETIIGIAGFTVSVSLCLFGVNVIAGGERDLRMRLTSMISDLDVIVWEADAGGARFTYLSDAATPVTGHPANDLESVAYWFDAVHPDDQDRAWRERVEAIERGGTSESEYRMVTPDGEVRWLQDVMRVEHTPSGEPVRYRGVSIDITDRKDVEGQVALYASLVEEISTALIVVRPNDAGDELELIAANPGAESVVLGEREALIGRPLREAIPMLDESLRQRILKVARTGEPFDADRIARLGNDPQRVYSAHGFQLPGGAVGVAFDDVTESALTATALRRQALHDGLTGLPNRSLLHDRLQQALREAERAQTTVALMFMDLDHFKEVNDALGHQYGDRLLVELSRRLERTLREADTIARLGGDEFALLLTTNATGDGASRVVKKIHDALAEPFDIDGVTIQTNASIGIALYPDHATSAELLTQRADVAMYTAKRGGGGWAVYSPDHDRSSVERLTLLTELRKAIEQDELDLHFQPVIDVTSRSVVGCEALIRWHHRTYGRLNPSLIIELAELSGLILPLTRWVASTAIHTLREWNDADLDLTIAINLSVRNLYDRKLVGWLSDELDEYGIPHEQLKVELTESEVMDDPLLAIEVLGALRDIGVTTSVDDFGTGYSSLQYLSRLPVAEIKIDQSFVANMIETEEDLTIVNTVIDLAHNLGMTVLAEGVEDDVTLCRLEELGCDRAQGYLIGKPSPLADFLDVVQQWETSQEM